MKTDKILDITSKNVKLVDPQLIALCNSPAYDPVGTSKKFEYIAVNVLMAVLAANHVFDRTKHKTVYDMNNAIEAQGWYVGQFFDYFLEEYGDGLRTHDIEDYPTGVTIMEARSELMAFYNRMVEVK